MRYLAILFLACMGLRPAAQGGHNLRPNSSCRFNKVVYNAEGMSDCAACRTDRKREEEFKKQEDKRVAAERVIAAQKEKERKIREAQARAVEAKQREAERQRQAAADKAAERKADQERREHARQAAANAQKGAVKSKDGSREPAEVDFGLLPFEDDKQKVYGFKKDGQVVFQQAFTGIRAYFSRLDSSNYFCLGIQSAEGEKEGIYKGYLLDRRGKVLTVNGISQFDYELV